MTDLLLSYLKDRNVSHETIEKIEHYHRLLLKWQKAINLVAPKTLKEAKVRHFLDSAQLMDLYPNDKPFKAVDMGSGGGFPALVLAMLRPQGEFHLIESDQRKGIFMETVSRETSTPITVHKKRIEDVEMGAVDIVSARALASLDLLFGYSKQFSPKMFIFQKGENYDQEIKQAHEKWSFDYELIPSLSSKTAQIIKITNLIEKD